jgi:hypothetical protein
MQPRNWPPDRGWFTPERVEYLKNLLQLVVLACAMPWLLGKLLSSPGQLVKHAGRAQVGG